MTRKYKKYPSVKPANTIHPSLNLSSSRSSHGSYISSAEQSVNDLIEHLRRTRVSDSTSDIGSKNALTATPRTVHPSLRNILELPETPPPRPRQIARPIGGQQLRRTPGPPPPSSWLEGRPSSSLQRNKWEGIATANGRILYRLERLPGVIFPPKNSLQHLLLRSVAINLTWHLSYDGEYLAELPNRIKTLLLSYIAVYSGDSPVKGHMRGLQPLFQRYSDDNVVDPASEVIRLDLSRSLGYYIDFKQLTEELTHRRPVRNLETCKAIPLSWDADLDLESPEPLLISPIKMHRFKNLRFLSLANPDTGSASWPALLHLLSHIPTLTHLSLAHWPVPTLTPNTIKAQIQRSVYGPLSSVSGNADSYTAFDNIWAEASTVLRKLSRATYCLKWLDLEGCGHWFGALSWSSVTPNGDVDHSVGPEWNGSWRDIEWLCLGPGWLPAIYRAIDGHSCNDPFYSLEQGGELQHLSASPAVSTHTPLSEDVGPTNIDFEAERVKELELYRHTLRKAKEVERHIRRIRKEGGGKWVDVSLGGQGEEEKNWLNKVVMDIPT